MKTNILFILVLIIILCPISFAQTDSDYDISLSTDAFFSALGYGGEIEGETYDTFEVGKARINLNADFKSDDHWIQVHYQADMETGELEAKELYLELGKQFSPNLKMTLQTGLISCPDVGIQPPPPDLEPFNYPLAIFTNVNDIGLVYCLRYKEFEFKSALTNGNGRKLADDNEAKDLSLRLGYYPAWGMLRTFYMKEVGQNADAELYGARADLNLPANFFLRVSGLVRESEGVKKKGWNVLCLNNVTDKLQLQGMYEEYDDGLEHLEYDLTKRWTGGFAYTFWDKVGFGINYWENTTGPEEWGFGAFSALGIPQFNLFLN